MKMFQKHVTIHKWSNTIESILTLTIVNATGISFEEIIKTAVAFRHILLEGVGKYIPDSERKMT